MLRNRSDPIEWRPRLVDEHAALDALRRQQLAQHHREEAFAGAEVDDCKSLARRRGRDHLSCGGKHRCRLDNLLDDAIGLHERAPQSRVALVAPPPSQHRGVGIRKELGMLGGARFGREALREPCRKFALVVGEVRKLELLKI